jgi:dethiobiotin synthetase
LTEGGVRPRRLVVVVGTATDVGKTWVAAHLLTDLRAAGLTVAARKPVQSFDPEDDPSVRDAAVLAAASGEKAEIVCAPHRWYEVPMAPPMAAEVLGRPPFHIGDLIDELSWPDVRVDVGLVETAGGIRSPLAADGDGITLCRALAPDLVVLVADGGLGAINAVRLTAGVIEVPFVVVLNRFDDQSDLHVRNDQWLRGFDGLRVVAGPGARADLVELVSG